MTAWYNENDPKAAAWLRELIKQGHIAPGDVDERSIIDVRPGDVEGYDQCHFFAGIGVWSYALRSAGWSDDRPVWTGSCPCQPFSTAGKRGGTSDARHLWPEFFRLIAECRPPAIFGEQVASKDGLAWLDFVHADLEGAGYAVGAVDICAAGFGAPHIRQRLYFVADAGRASGCAEQRHEPGEELGRGETTPHDSGFRERRAACGVADAPDGDGGPGERGAKAGARPDGEWRRGSASGRVDGVVGNPSGRGWGKFWDAALPGGGGHSDGAEQYRLLGNSIVPGLEGFAGYGRNGDEPRRDGKDSLGSVAPASGPCNGFWRDAAWIPCRDGKWRPVEPGTFPLAHGAPVRVVQSGDHSESINANATGEARVMRLRGYGNAIVAPVAEAFIRAYMEVCG